MLIDPGDEVLMADPGYPCNRNFVRMMGGVPAEVPVGAESAYQLLPEMVARYWTPRTKAVMVASPSNPTGTLMPEESLRTIARTTRERGGALIVDEIYHGLVYDGEYTTALKHGDDLFVINSFSKYFNMTGWRLGWLVVPPAYVREFDKLSQNIYLSAPSVAQHAALAVSSPDTRNPRARRAEFRRGATSWCRLPSSASNYGGAAGRLHYADCSAMTGDVLRSARPARTGGSRSRRADFGVHGASAPCARLNEFDPVLAKGRRTANTRQPALGSASTTSDPP